MITGKSIAKGALIVMAATLASRLFGFFREMKIAEYFGLRGGTDEYLVAFAISSAVGLAVAAALIAGFVPVFNGYLVENDKENASKVANTLLNSIFTALLAAAGLGILLAPLLAAKLAPGFDAAGIQITADLIRLMFPGLIFVGLTGLTSGYLNSRQHFLTPALGPMVTSIIIIFSIVVLGPAYGIRGLAIGTLIGFAGQFLLQLPVMYALGYRYRPEFAVSHPGVKRVFKLMVPVLISSMVPPFMLLVERGLASQLGVGSISALNYAFRLMQLPQGLFVMAVAVPLFPALSSFAAQKDFARLKEIMTKGISFLALIMIPASAGLIVLDEPVVRLLFERGAFDAKDTVPTAYALAFYSLALLPLALRDIFRRSFYALQDTLTPVFITVAILILNVVLDLLLVRILGIGGLALGASISAAAEAVILYFMLSRRLIKLPGREMAVLLVKVAFAAVLMAVAVFYISAFAGTVVDIESVRGRMIQVGVSVLVGIIIYAAAIILLKVKEVHEVTRMAGGFLTRLTRTRH